MHVNTKEVSDRKRWIFDSHWADGCNKIIAKRTETFGTNRWALSYHIRTILLCALPCYVADNFCVDLLEGQDMVTRTQHGQATTEHEQTQKSHQPCCWPMGDQPVSSCVYVIFTTNSIEQGPSSETNICSLGHKFPAFNGTWKFIIIFPRVWVWL
jgi:hypothetical protein